MKLNDKELRELDAWIAENVFGWHRQKFDNGSFRHNLIVPQPFRADKYRKHGWHDDLKSIIESFPKYTTDPAAVLGLLEKYDWIAGNHLLDGDYFCEINYPESRIIVRAPTFALAATLALLKAHGVETE